MATTPVYGDESITLQGEMLTVSVEVTLDGVTETVQAQVHRQRADRAACIEGQLALSVQELIDQRVARAEAEGDLLTDLGTRVEAARSKLSVAEAM